MKAAVDAKQLPNFSAGAEWWDSAKQSKITAQGTNPNAPGWRPASSWFNYDVNGNLKSTYDDGGNQPGNGRAFTYWTDLRGQVQRRDELVNVRVDGDGRIVGAAGDRKHNYYYLNGNRVGNQGNDGIDQVDYVKELAGKLQKGSDSQYKVFTPVGTADFDESFMTINGVYPGTSPGVWTVRDGDSLKSIASALWGDETLWYVLADANGLKSTDELKAGRLLTVPNKVTNVHNTASTFKPYDPGKAIGNTQPTLPDPPPPPGRGGGCGGFLPVIAIVVAVVATVFTAGALTAPAGASFSTIMSAGGTALTGGAGLAGAGAAAVGGAVGAASAQGVMIAGGAQNGFDWKGVALGAVGGAVTAGAGGALGVANNVQTAVALGAARSVATQGIGVATGLQHSFDWKGVAASAIASGVGFEAGRVIGSLVSGMHPDVGRFITRVGSGVAAGAASTVVRGGSLGRNVGAIAMDAVASTIGNMVVDQVQSASVGKTGTNASRLYGVGGDINAVTVDAVRTYGSDPGQQFANQANWNLQLDAGLREQAFVGGLQDQFGQLANDALAASRAENAALKQRLGSEFAGSANWALAQQRAEHAAAAARQAAATRSGLAGFDLGRGSNDWSDNATGFDLGRGGWSDGSTLSRAEQWLDRPLQPLQGLADTVRRGNAMMADGLDAVGLSGLAGAQRALGDVISGAVPTRPWEIALSAAPLAVKAPGALRFAGETFGPQIDQLVVRATPGLRLGVVPDGPIAARTFSNLFPEDIPQAAKIIPNEQLATMSQRRLAYVVTQDGSLVVGRNNINQGHIDLAGGQPVLAAGEFGVHAGQLKFIDNFSGHYRPSGAAAQSAAEQAFRSLGFNVDGLYIERTFK